MELYLSLPELLLKDVATPGNCRHCLRKADGGNEQQKGMIDFLRGGSSLLGPSGMGVHRPLGTSGSSGSQLDQVAGFFIERPGTPHRCAEIVNCGNYFRITLCNILVRFAAHLLVCHDMSSNNCFGLGSLCKKAAAFMQILLIIHQIVRKMEIPSRFFRRQNS